MATTPIKVRVQKHRESLRRSGLRPIQIWVPDTHKPDFAEECRRQCRLANKADQKDSKLELFLEAAALSVEGWTA
jgi:hypothetical protein